MKKDFKTFSLCIAFLNFEPFLGLNIGPEVTIFTTSEDDCITVYSTFGILLVLEKKYVPYIFLCLTLNPSWGPCIGHGSGSTRLEQRTTQKNETRGVGLDEVRLEDAGIN